MNWGGIFLGAIVAVAGLSSVGCGGDSGITSTPIVTIKYAGPCEAGRQVECACPGETMGAQTCKTDGSAWDTCLGCDGTGGSGGGSTASSSGTGGEGGGTTASSTSSGSSSASSSSSSSGTGGGPCVPTLAACDPAVQCGDVDNGCGVILKCGGCEDGQGQANPYLSCDAASHTCQCAAAGWNTEAVAFCKAQGGGGAPLFCGPLSPKSTGKDCPGGGETTTGEAITCCAP